MKRYFILLLVCTLAFTSCRKVVDTNVIEFNPAAQAAEDEATIQTYLLLKNITNAVRDPSGLYYVIHNAGTGDKPTLNSSITVAFKLELTDGTVVETKNSINYLKLSDRIKGWQIALPLIGKGGSISLYVPSALGFGNLEGGIPANSVLVYDITLQGFVN
jgi:FKBP-type peptidyl-prolyl cis-trans isomerase FkpA